GNVPLSGQLGEGAHHRSGAAADQVLRSLVLLQELGNKSLEATAAVVGGKMHFGAGGDKIVHASQQVSGAHAIEDGNALDTLARQLVRIAADSEQFPNIGQKRRLPDPARNEPDVI